MRFTSVQEDGQGRGCGDVPRDLKGQSDFAALLSENVLDDLFDGHPCVVEKRQKRINAEISHGNPALYGLFVLDALVRWGLWETNLCEGGEKMALTVDILAIDLDETVVDADHAAISRWPTVGQGLDKESFVGARLEDDSHTGGVVFAESILLRARLVRRLVEKIHPGGPLTPVGSLELPKSDAKTGGQATPCHHRAALEVTGLQDGLPSNLCKQDEPLLPSDSKAPESSQQKVAAFPPSLSLAGNSWRFLAAAHGQALLLRSAPLDSGPRQNRICSVVSCHACPA